MKKSWQKIENWIKINHPDILDTLNEAATEQDITRLESALGLKLPEDFKEFLSVHNGQSWTHLNLFDGDRLLSIDDIIRDWENWKSVLPVIDANCKEQFGVSAGSEPEPGIKDDWWNALWIPITSDGCGDSYCIDLDPTSEGISGQIIRMWHDHPRRELIASSFREWIDNYTSDLENGIYTSSNDIGWGGIVKQE
jgi:cell wall assembly regulator SMI1